MRLFRRNACPELHDDRCRYGDPGTRRVYPEPPQVSEVATRPQLCPHDDTVQIPI
jgi:hypothetical protein